MKLRLGILGADDTLAIILSVVKKYNEIDVLPIVYWDEEEVIDKLRPYAESVDMWLFSGHVPYSIAKEWGGISKPMFYIPYTGSSLYRTLLHIAYERRWKLELLSYDTFELSDLEQTFAEANIEVKPVFLKHYPSIISAQELSNFHYNLWQTNQTQAAVTCLRSAYLELQRLGVPVFRVLPAVSSVEAIINLILRTQETLHFRDTQIAVQLIEIDTFNMMTKDRFSTDEIHRIELKVTKKLLEYTKKVQGSLKIVGPGRYVVFTTRGLLQGITGNFTLVPDIENIRLFKDAVTCGIGIGQTAYEAEINAGKALLHAKEHGTGSWMTFFDDNTIVGPLGQPQQISYSCAPEEFQSVSQKTSLSVSTLSKIDSVLRKIKKTEISAHELAQYLNIMPRSARRILLELEAAGYAKAIGEVNPHPRGRPRKIYQILFNS